MTVSMSEKNLPLSRQDQQMLELVLELIALVAHQKLAQVPHSIEIGFNQGGGLQKYLQPSMARDNVFKLLTALAQPEELIGGVAIWVNKEIVFLAEDGKVIEDSLNLGMQVKEKFEDTELKEVEGKKLLKYVSTILTVFGKKENDCLKYEGKYYSFSEKGGEIRVVNKEGQEILNNQGFTDIASKEDMNSLNKLEEIVDTLKLYPAQSIGFKL